MKYKIEPEGSIVLMPNPHEVETIVAALCSKYVRLMQHQVTEEKIDDIIQLRMSLSDAIVESNKKKISVVAVPNMVDNRFLPKAGLWNRIGNLLDPPFTTEDFETADSLTGDLVHLETMDYLPGKSMYPYNVSGALFYHRKWYRCCWDAHGNCSCPPIGKNAAKYDLIRTNNRNITSAKCIGFAFVILIVAAFFYTIIL